MLFADGEGGSFGEDEFGACVAEVGIADSECVDAGSGPATDPSSTDALFCARHSAHFFESHLRHFWHCFLTMTKGGSKIVTMRLPRPLAPPGFEGEIVIKADDFALKYLLESIIDSFCCEKNNLVYEAATSCLVSER